MPQLIRGGAKTFRKEWEESSGTNKGGGGSSPSEVPPDYCRPKPGRRKEGLALLQTKCRVFPLGNREGKLQANAPLRGGACLSITGGGGRAWLGGVRNRCARGRPLVRKVARICELWAWGKLDENQMFPGKQPPEYQTVAAQHNPRLIRNRRKSAHRMYKIALSFQGQTFCPKKNKGRPGIQRENVNQSEEECQPSPNIRKRVLH